MTVTGPIDQDQIGIALTHEHVFCDLRKPLIVHSKETEAFEQLEVNLQNLWLIKRDWMNNVDNVQLSDYETAVNELLLFKAAGGSTVVDLTVTGINPDQVKLRRVAQATGLNIVRGDGLLREQDPPERSGRKDRGGAGDRTAEQHRPWLRRDRYQGRDSEDRRGRDREQGKMKPTTTRRSS